jgi:hypothetical protein
VLTCSYHRVLQGTLLTFRTFKNLQTNGYLEVYP